MGRKEEAAPTHRIASKIKDVAKGASQGNRGVGAREWRAQKGKGGG